MGLLVTSPGMITKSYIRSRAARIQTSTPIGKLPLPVVTKPNTRYVGPRVEETSVVFG